MEFLLSEKFRLELHWSMVRYNRDQIALLDGCYFTGPALSEVVELNQEDYIDLDFASQYIVFVDKYYISRLSWKGVSYSTNKILLDNVVLNNLNLNIVPKLNNDDYIVVDTKDHEDMNHMYNLFYQAYLIRNDGLLYNFKESK